jgi:hypothetical protein
MKKTKSFVVITLILVTTLAVTADARPRLGVKAGIAGADQTWEYSSALGTVNRNSRLGLAAGMFAELPIMSALQLIPEALYVQKGSQVEVAHMTYTGVPDGTETYKDRIDYLSLGITAKVKTSARSLGLYFLGGPRLDLKIGTSSDIDSPNMNAILDAYKSSVVGLAVGFGAEKDLGESKAVFIEFRYDYDFGEAAEYVGDEATLTIDNRAFLVLVGVAF